MDTLTREEIWVLSERVKGCEEAVANPIWKEIYRNLWIALDHCDATLARAEEPKKKKKEFLGEEVGK